MVAADPCDIREEESCGSFCISVGDVGIITSALPAPAVESSMRWRFMAATFE